MNTIRKDKGNIRRDKRRRIKGRDIGESKREPQEEPTKRNHSRGTLKTIKETKHPKRRLLICKLQKLSPMQQ